jgi:transposase InsO family protein
MVKNGETEKEEEEKRGKRGREKYYEGKQETKNNKKEVDNNKINDILSQVYYNISGSDSFSGINRIYNHVKKEYPFIKRSDVYNWLKTQDTYSIHYPFRAKFQRSRIVVGGIDYMWEMDLMDMKNFVKYNKGVQYILVIIDVFSRYVWTIPCKNKSSETVYKALSEILRFTSRKPKYVRSDKGKEFTNKMVQELFKKNNIQYFVTQSESKAAIVERVIKTIKGRISKYMYHKQTRKYIQVLSDITNSYNETYHSSIGRSPKSVTKDIETNLWYEMYASDRKPYVVKGNKKDSLLEIGQYVRISFLRHTFSREYREKWSTEIFQIYKRYMRDGIVVYQLRDLSGEDILGSFYRYEIQHVHIDKNTLYKIEKIIRSKRLKNGKKMYFVKWMNWGDKFNSWVSEEDIKDL